MKLIIDNKHVAKLAMDAKASDHATRQMVLRELSARAPIIARQVAAYLNGNAVIRV